MSVHPPDEQVKEIYETARTIAFVGATPDDEKPAHHIVAYIQEMGYHIVPVNPHHAEILGETCYPSLTDIPFPVDVVDILRPAEEAPAIAEQAVTIGAKVLWLQLGIHSDEAQVIALEAGMTFLSDICIMMTHMRLGLDPV